MNMLLTFGMLLSAAALTFVPKAVSVGVRERLL